MVFSKQSILPQLIIGAVVVAAGKALQTYFPLDSWTPILQEVLNYVGGAFGVNAAIQTVRYMAPDKMLPEPLKTGTSGFAMKPMPLEDTEEVGEPKPFIPEVKSGE